MTIQNADWWHRRRFMGGLGGMDDGGNSNSGMLRTGVLGMTQQAATAPTISLAAGTYDRAMTQAIVLTSSQGLTCYYTTDGSKPTVSSPSVASGSTVGVNSTATLKVIASGGSYSNSSVTSASYTIVSPNLYIVGNGFNTGTSMVDSSGYAKTITATSASFATAQSKFNGSSITFNGSTSYVSTAASTDFGFDTGDFIMCGWVRASSSQAASYPAILYNASGAYGANMIGIYAAHASVSNHLCVFVNNYTGSSPTIDSGVDIRDNAWHFWMFTRVGTAHKLFLDGAQVGSTYTTSASIDGGGSRSLYVGMNPGDSGTPMTGYQSHVYTVKGTGLSGTDAAAWNTANVAFAPHPNLLLHMDGTNGSTTFTDSSNQALTVTNNGSATISTASPKYGTGAGSFNGSTQYLNLGGQSAFAFGSADFTVEGWINTTTAAPAGNPVVFDTRPSGTDGAYPTLYLASGNNKPNYYVSAASRISAASAVPANSWVHLCVCRLAGVTTLYLSGVSQGTYSDTNAYLNGANAPVFSIDGKSRSTNYVSGQYDEWAVTNGYAKYTANFTPSGPYYP